MYSLIFIIVFATFLSIRNIILVMKEQHSRHCFEIYIFKYNKIYPSLIINSIKLKKKKKQYIHCRAI